MLAERVKFFTESVIRETTRQAVKHNAINLAQGMPDFDCPEELKEAACKAIRDGFNQYSVTWGCKELRDAVAEKAKWFNRIDVDPDKHVTVCCGATECMMAAMLAVINPGDEVIAFQPYYENYGPDGLLSGANIKWVDLKPPHWDFDFDDLKKAFSNKTRAVILNTPHNPTGKVFSREEIQLIATLCNKYDALAITDEIYEHIIYVDRPHLSIAAFDGMADRTITISGHSKTYSATGWRLGYCIANEEISNGIRRVHDFLTVGAPHPLQLAGAAALRMPTSYYVSLLEGYRRRREVFMPYLKEAGFGCESPDGAYYVMCDFSPFGFDDDRKFLQHLLTNIGVAGVPGSSFLHPPEAGRKLIRFMFAKKEETLHQAGERLLKLRGGS
jgi:aspartate/methionine/tyrosine aminotransferase